MKQDYMPYTLTLCIWVILCFCTVHNPLPHPKADMSALHNPFMRCVMSTLCRLPGVVSKTAVLGVNWGIGV